MIYVILALKHCHAIALLSMQMRAFSRPVLDRADCLTLNIIIVTVLSEDLYEQKKATGIACSALYRAVSPQVAT